MYSCEVSLVFFVIYQVSILNKEENKRDTIVDRVFRKALQEFHIQLISSYSVLMKVRPLRIETSILLSESLTFLLISVVRIWCNIKTISTS